MTSSLTEVLPAEALATAGASGALADLAAAAEAIVRPESTREVAETLRWAVANQVGVLPVGSGERLGRRPPAGRYLVLSTDRLAGLEIYEPADVTLTAKAGTRLGAVNDTLGAHGQWLPFDPPRAASRTVGGLVATGASGPVGTGYGELRNHVLGATVVCGDGRVLRLGGRVVKNVAGFDLLRPVVGSRGRLGVITSVCLRAFPVPAVDRLLVLRADDLAGLRDVAAAIRTAPVLPASSVAWAPASQVGAGAALVVRLHGAVPTVEADQVALEHHAGVALEPLDDAESVVDAVRDHATRRHVVLTCSLLPSRLFEGLAAVRARLGDVAVFADTYGGTARVASPAADEATLAALQADIEVLGGALNVVAGAAGPESEELGSRPTAAELELAASLEQVFDPEGVLWPCRR